MINKDQVFVHVWIMEIRAMGKHETQIRAAVRRVGFVEVVPLDLPRSISPRPIQWLLFRPCGHAFPWNKRPSDTRRLAPYK